MKVKLLHNVAVRFSEGTVLEVSDEEGKRLIAFKNAEAVTEKKETKKKK